VFDCDKYFIAIPNLKGKANRGLPDELEHQWRSTLVASAYQRYSVR